MPPRHVGASPAEDRLDGSAAALDDAIGKIESAALLLHGRKFHLAAAPDITGYVIGVYIQERRFQLQVRWFHNGGFKEAYVCLDEIRLLAD